MSMPPAKRRDTADHRGGGQGQLPRWKRYLADEKGMTALDGAQNVVIANG